MLTICLLLCRLMKSQLIWNQDGKSAHLRRNLRSLYALGNEFEFGVGSEKAAKPYNSRGRGANRYPYNKWNLFWDLIAIMVNKGRDANDATIYSIYKHDGYKNSVTSIIKHLEKERMNGTGYRYPQFLLYH